MAPQGESDEWSDVRDKERDSARERGREMDRRARERWMRVYVKM